MTLPPHTFDAFDALQNESERLTMQGRTLKLMSSHYWGMDSFSIMYRTDPAIVGRGAHRGTRRLMSEVRIATYVRGHCAASSLVTKLYADSGELSDESVRLIVHDYWGHD